MVGPLNVRFLDLIMVVCRYLLFHFIVGEIFSKQISVLNHVNSLS